MRIPKYLNWSTTLNWIASAIGFFLSFELSNNIEDLVWFTLYPEISPNYLINWSKAGIDLFKMDISKITSSAYRAILCSTVPTVIPQNCGWERIAISNGSIVNVNNKGERGQPRRHPLLIFIGFEIFLFVKISAVYLLDMTCIHLIKEFPQPNLFKTLKRWGHSTLSKAFSASDNKAVSGLFSLKWMIFSILLTLWKPCLPDINPFLSLFTIFGRILCNLIARSLHIILRSEFSKLIGLKFLHLLGVWLVLAVK